MAQETQIVSLPKMPAVAADAPYTPPPGVETPAAAGSMDIVARLRMLADQWLGGNAFARSSLSDAADEIARLRIERDELLADVALLTGRPVGAL